MRTKPMLGAILATIATLAAWHLVRAQDTSTSTVTRVDTSKRPHFANAPGWEWMVQPVAFRIHRGKFQHSGDDSYIVTDSVVDADGGLRIFFVQVVTGQPTDGFPDLHFVAFDAAGGRYQFKRDSAASMGRLGNGGVSVYSTTFTLDPKVLVPDKAAYIGVERLSAKPR